MKLSIVDQSPVSSGSTPAEALHNTIELARLADRLGYERYWIAEHHAIDSFASPAPEVLIARVAAETSAIRVGAGGILLPHYSPLKVAEVFRMLHALHPGRIDLGLGRAPGGTARETYALRRDRGERIHAHAHADDFTEQLTELLAFLYSDFPANHPFAKIKVTPAMPGVPPVWLLGSSPWSASAAAHFGLPYAFAHFIDPEPTRPAVESYRLQFKPSRYLSAPRAIVALGVLCADTEQEAQRLLGSARLFRRRIQQGIAGPIPSLEEAERELGPYQAPVRMEASEWPRYVVGAPEQVKGMLTRMAGDLHLEELMVVTIVHDHQARMRSYELLAQAFDLAHRLVQDG